MSDPSRLMKLVEIIAASSEKLQKQIDSMKAKQDEMGTKQDEMGTKQDIMGTKQDIMGTKQDEISLDVIKLTGFLKTSMSSMALKLDFTGANNDCTPISRAILGTASGRKTAITGWFKVWVGTQLLPLDKGHELEQLDSTKLGKSDIKNDLDLFKLMEFVLDKLSKQTRGNKRKTRTDELEFLGSQLWKEMSSMIKNPEPKDDMSLPALELLGRDWVSVQTKIKRIREEEEIELEKHRTLSLKQENSVPVPPSETTSASSIDVANY